MKLFSVTIGLIAALLFGIATPLSKIILSQINSFQLAGLLYIGAGLSFLPHILKNHKMEFLAIKQTGQIKYLLGIIISGGVLGPLCLMIGLQTANATSVSIWLNMELVATALLGVLFFKDHLDRYAMAGIAVTLCAGILVSAQESFSGIVSGLFVLVACTFWGIDNHLTAIVDVVSPKTVTFIKGSCGGLTNLLIGMVLSEGIISIKYIPVVLLLGIFSYGISIVFYITSAQNLGATRSQILFSTAPFWGIFTAHILLGESLNLIVIASFILLVLGIALTSISSHFHKHHHDEIIHQHLHRHDDGHHDHIHSEDFKNTMYNFHVHKHKETSHEHTHYPDMHHRHKH